MSDGNVEQAKIVSSGNWGTVFQGVGDKEMETHFTFVVNEGFHVSTYLNNNLLHGLDKGDIKIKVEQDNL